MSRKSRRAILAATAPLPAALFGANGYAALVRKGDQLTVLAQRSDAFTIQQWLLAMGDRRKPEDPSLAAQRLCDREGCSAPMEGGGVFMLDKTTNAAEEDCGRVSVLAGPVPIGARCADTGIVMDRDLIRSAGSIALYMEPQANGDIGPRWRIVTARDLQASRPWSPGRVVPPPKPLPKPAAQPPATDTPMDSVIPETDN